MSKIIVFSNQKGGTGKSTMCIQFANFLKSKRQKVVVLDADPQQSIYHLRERELATNEGATLPWQILQLAGQTNIEQIMEKAKQMDGWVLIDCPGTITDKSLLPIFIASDVAVIPYRYDDFVVDSTISFIKVLRKVSKTKICFLPNCIDTRIKFANQESIRNVFEIVGPVLSRIKQCVAVQRLSTLRELDAQQKNVLKPTFDELLKEIKE